MGDAGVLTTVTPPTVNVTVPVGNAAPATTGMQNVRVVGEPNVVGLGLTVTVSLVPGF